MTTTIDKSIEVFFMTELEQKIWFENEQRKHNEIHSLLSHLKFIPSLWKSSNGNTIIISKSAKKANMLQLTRFDNNNIPSYDLCRTLDNISDFVSEN